MRSHFSLVPDTYYHIFNHAIGDEIMFKDDKDYCRFIGKYSHYLTPVADTLAYCLMPNHFHISLKIKSHSIILNQLSKKTLTNVDSKIHYAFASFFNGYVQAYNKRYERMGGLFVGKFKRKEFYADEDLRTLVCYIHNNPVEAGLVPSPEKWPYSSFHHITTTGSASRIPICIDELMRLFDDLENLICVHGCNAMTK